ncbi:MAG: iron-siderophore ABC transporter substrate-binding protein [Cellulomonas iranensis]|uniref:ABC transporter substrate-binding protein n=1 Tax=Cellulomonas iranensis TaxID=76862 RepID=UPI001B11D3AC|nr:iron-siderophore ABC transporter substrate-binding protein [Cellulomonas iranensis]MBO9570579.1 iron-siderophore ABC transporter substrate-binding protein [Cellulomonas iranensis]UCN14040.1 iron-siderophore ABC transporter substrate-binding protein [Cellulomonas iranensis]
MRSAVSTVRSRVAVLAAVTALGLGLSACAADADAGTADPTPSASADASDAPRVVEHARGETEVPAHPQRVVVLEPVQLDTAVALGVEPVGAAVLNEALGVPAYLGDAAADVQTVGTVQEPNVQKIAALQPDLIIGTESRHSALYDQLSDVAPTVFMATQTDPWQDNVRFTANALGDEADAQELLDAYDARCQEIADEFGTAGQTAQLIRPRDGILTLYGPTSFAGSTLECVGFTTPERDWENSISVDVSPENVLDAKADHVFVTTTDVTDESSVPEAVRANAAAFPQLHLVDQAWWITGVGPLGGQAVLDDIEKILSAAS